MRAKLGETKEELNRRRHLSIPEQGQWLREVVMGFFAYHVVPTNIQALMAFRDHVRRLWLRALRRRSWPSDRFAVKYPRWEPYAGKLHVRICAGGAQQ
jgi:RNA-directed DNA polymerase